MNAVAARWDGFLNQVRERFVAILREAQEGCPQLLEQADFDPIPMGNAWTAIDLRCTQLASKVEDTWHGQVESAFEQAGASGAVLEHERRKGEAVTDWMEVEREKTRVGIFASAGRAFYQRAAAEHGRPFACTRCGAPLQIPFTFRALNVTCPHCTTVNGFEPGTRMRMGETFVHSVCEEAALPQLVALKQADRALRRARPTTLAHLQAYEHANIAFWHAYLSARVRLLPDTAAAFDADLRGRMRHVYDAFEREQAWIRAGRPRQL